MKLCFSSRGGEQIFALLEIPETPPQIFRPILPFPPSTALAGRMNQFSTAMHAPSGGARGSRCEVIVDRWRCENDECGNRMPCIKKRMDPVARAPRCYRCGDRLTAMEGETDPKRTPNDSPVREPRVQRDQGDSQAGRRAPPPAVPYGPH